MLTIYKLKNILPLFFLIIIFFGIFVRSVEVLNHNYVFGFDQGREYLVLREIVVSHKLRLIGAEIGSGSAGFTGIFQGPFFYYLLLPTFILFQGDPYGGIVIMFLFGIGAIGFIYFLIYKIFGYFYGLLAAALVSISPPLISQSRFLWSPHPGTFFILLAFYFIYYIKKNNRNIFLSSFFSGFIYNFEFATAVPMSIGLILYCLLICKLRKVKQYLYLIGGFLCAFSPMVIFEFKHNFQGIKGLLSYFSESKHSFINLMEIIKGVQGIFIAFMNSYIDSFPKQNLVSGWIIIAIVLIIVCIAVYKEKEESIKHFILYLFILPLTGVLTYLFLRVPVYPYYLIDLNLSFVIFICYCILFTSKNRNYLILSLLSIFILVQVLQFIPFSINNFIKDYSDYGGDAKIKGKMDAIDYVYKDAKGKKFGLLVFTPPVYTYTYDYILLWYAQKKYNYIPYKDKKGLFYLIMEVDPQKPWSYKGWLETVIKSGKIIETVKLPSGIIVQKRNG